MPKKAKRVAARQSELSRKSRQKGRRGPTGIPAQPPLKDQQRPLEQQESTQVVGEPDRVAVPPEPWTTARPRTAAATRTPGQPAPRSAAGTRHARAPREVSYYVKRELTRISFIGAFIVAVLVVLTFVLH